MSLWDDIVNVTTQVAQAVGDAIETAVENITQAVEQAAETVDNAVDAAADTAQGALDAVRGWVNDNWGDTPLGDIGRAVVDLLKIGVAATEFIVHVAVAMIVLSTQVLGDVVTGQWGRIPSRFGAFGSRVEEYWQDALKDMNTFAVSASELGREVPGVKKLEAKAWSVAAGLRETKKGKPDPRTYKSIGKRYEFRLTKTGEMEFRQVTMTCAEPAWKPLIYAPKDRATMISFNDKRTGDVVAGEGEPGDPFRPAPKFEAVVASADRVLAKEEGKDNFYFMLMDELFWGPRELRPGSDPVDVELLQMPSNYVKLDPEKNRKTAKRDDLLLALDGDLPIIPQSERHPVFREALRMGLLDLVVKVFPRVWYLIDTRPPFESGPVPSGLDTYDHVTYGSQTFLIGGLNSRTEQSIDFDKVLDIGVGNTHFHEQWSNIYSGEMRNTRLEYFQNLAVGEFNYSILNGPLSDGDHFADGTCNFYILVRVRDSEHFVVLYCDEQTLFTQRWRLADPIDKEWVAFEKRNFSLAAALDDSRDGLMHGFKLKHFWSPFGDRYLDDTSRMSVSRTVIVLSGRDPDSNRYELYSCNFGFGVCDRTWRWRGLSKFDVGFLDADDVKNGTLHSIEEINAPNVIFPQTLHVREDMHITMRGTAARGRETIRGVWAQTYLPATCEQVPSREEHAKQQRAAQDAGQELPQKPCKGFDHHWTFWSEKAFRLADRFSHLGVYAEVDERIQFYELDVLDQLSTELSGTDWVFRDDPSIFNDPHPVQPGQLYIKARKLNWKAVAAQMKELQRAFLVSLGTVMVWVGQHADEILLKWERAPSSQKMAEDQLRASRRSMYNADGLFVLHHRGPLGWIAVWKDKRDDDLISLSDLPMEVTLLRRGQEDEKLRVRFKQNHRVYQPPVVQQASVVLRNVGSASSIEVTFASDRVEHEMNVNIWSFNLAALDCDSDNMVVFLLKNKRRMDLERVPDAPGTWAGSFPVDEDWVAKLQKYFGEGGRFDYGTSLWFENALGHVACPEKLQMAVVVE